MERYYCAVCNKEFVLAEDYGGCSICEWMHDPIQEGNPDYRGGANRDSLNNHKKEWQNLNTPIAATHVGIRELSEVAV